MDDFFIKGKGQDDREANRGDVIKSAREERKDPRSRVDDLWQDTEILESRGKPQPEEAALEKIRGPRRFYHVPYPLWMKRIGARLQMLIIIGIEVALLAAIILTALYYGLYYGFAQFDIFSPYSWQRVQAFYNRGGAIPPGFIGALAAAAMIFGYGAFRLIKNNLEEKNRYADFIFKPIIYPLNFVIGLVIAFLRSLHMGGRNLIRPIAQRKWTIKRYGLPADDGDDFLDTELPSGGGNVHDHAPFESEARKVATAMNLKTRKPRN